MFAIFHRSVEVYELDRLSVKQTHIQQTEEYSDKKSAPPIE